jgi:hypothetical protein
MPQTKNAAPAEPSRESNSQVAEPMAREAVALRAYELFQERGREPGRDLDDWLRAEHEVQETRQSRA